MIKGHCHTNLDDWNREKWPKEFVAVPRVGECVKAESGRYLKVVRVTHCMVEERAVHIGDYPVPHPEIDIELHKVAG
jgi:hypothetical protein